MIHSCAKFATAVRWLALMPFAAISAGLSAPDEQHDSPIRWTFETGGAVVASPVVVDGYVYIGSEDGRFYALDARTGALQWTYPTAARVTSTAAVAADTVVFESGNTLYALDRKGALLWQQALADADDNDRIDAWDFHHASPVIDNGIVYTGLPAGLVVGLDLKTGKRLYQCDPAAGNPVRSTPAVDNGRIFFGDWEGVFYACDLDAGDVLWRYDTRDDVTFSWKNAIQTTPVVVDGAVYFAGRSCRLYSLDAATGQRRWSRASPTDQWLIGGPRIDGGVVYIASSDQHLFQAFDAATGKPLWKAGTDGRTWGAPYIDTDRIYIANNSLTTLDKQTGAVRASLPFPRVHAERRFGTYTDRRSSMHSSPAKYGDSILVGSDDGLVYAVVVD